MTFEVAALTGQGRVIGSVRVPVSWHDGAFWADRMPIIRIKASGVVARLVVRLPGPMRRFQDQTFGPCSLSDPRREFPRAVTAGDSLTLDLGPRPLLIVEV